MDAVVTIRLENQSRPSFQVRNGETSFRLSSFGVGNVPFQLNYDTRYISNNDTYFLRGLYHVGRTDNLSNSAPSVCSYKG